MEYFVDSKEKKEKLKLWCKQNPKYRVQKNIMYGLYALIVITFIGMIVSIAELYTLLLLAGLFMFSFYIGITAQVFMIMYTVTKYRLPYSTQERENGILYPDYFEFRFFDAQRKMEEGMCIYRIAYSNIQTLDYQDRLGIITITGRSEYLVYDNYFANIINWQLSQPQSAPNAKFTFMLTGELKYSFLAQLRNKIQLSQSGVA